MIEILLFDDYITVKYSDTTRLKSRYYTHVWSCTSNREGSRSGVLCLRTDTEHRRVESCDPLRGGLVGKLKRGSGACVPELIHSELRSETV